MNDTTMELARAPVEQRIADRLDTSILGGLSVSDRAGGLAFRDVTQVMEVAKLMAISGVAVPKHLRGNPGACLAVVIQALEWRLSPYAVANKSYSVNDRLAYESQLIQAVILQRAPIDGRFRAEYSGAGQRLKLRIVAKLKGSDQEVDYESPEIGEIKPQNSPLWKSDPPQQLYYYSARALCRRHFPDVLLGVYARDEIDNDDDERGPERARDVTPPKKLADKLDMLADASKSAPKPTVPVESFDPDTGEVETVPDKIIEASATTQPQEERHPTMAASTGGEAASSSGATPKTETGAAADEDEPAPAEAQRLGLTGDMRTALMAFAKAASSTESEKTLDRGAMRFLEDKGIEEGTAAYEAVRAIVMAHRARIKGESSPAEADAAVKKALAA